MVGLIRTFSDSFWGPNDMGVSVLLDRMRDAKTTNEEIRQFYQERVIIEDEYATKLAKLSTRVLGTVELGTLQSSLKMLAKETDSVAKSHAAIAGQLKTDLVDTHVLFAETSLGKRRNVQSGIEELFRLKIQQQVELKKATKLREQIMHDRPAQVNDDGYETASLQLSGTVERWNTEWRTACEKFQKLEEERIETLKTGMWAYANIFSQACVTDDESCERLRVSLEKCDAARDIAECIKLKGTGSKDSVGPEAAQSRAKSSTREGTNSPSRRQSLASGSKTTHTMQSGTKLKGAEDSHAQTIAVNQYPLDGITQLCRSDSSATFASNSTSMAGSYVTASSVYSSMPGSQRETPNLNSSSGFVRDEAGRASMGKIARKKSFIERVDMWPRRSPSPSKPESPKPLKAQKTGSSIFDALRPARSRSRASMRNETNPASYRTDHLQQESMLNIGQNMLPIQSITDPTASSDYDPIAAALEQLRVDSTSPSLSRRGEEHRPSSFSGSSNTPAQPPLATRIHRRFPSRSESSSPILTNSTNYIEKQHPNKYVSHSNTISSLGAPPAAHSAAEMRQTKDEFSQRNASIFTGPDRSYVGEDKASGHSSAKRGRATSIHTTQNRRAPGNLRRSPSPNPAMHVTSQTAQSTVGRPISASSMGTVKALRSPSRNRSDHGENHEHGQRLDQSCDSDHSNSYINGYSNARRYDQHSQFNQDHQVQVRSRTTVEDLKYGNPTNRHSLGSANSLRRDPEQPVIRTRSKSFVDVPRPRAQFTRDGRQILTFVLALYDYQATIPEEIDFRQGDTLSILEMREDGWWIGEITDVHNSPRGLVPSNFFKRIETYR